MLTIRPERPTDYPAIEDILKACFGREGQNEAFNEWTLVRAIRRDPAYIPALSLVAQEDGEVVGHVLFSRCHIGDTPSLALAPLAVRPDRQRRGIAAALVQRGLELAACMGEKTSLVLGGPYYTRFGYAPLPKGITLAEGLDDHLYLLELAKGAAQGLTGQVRYCRPFYDEKGRLL